MGQILPNLLLIFFAHARNHPDYIYVCHTYTKVVENCKPPHPVNNNIRKPLKNDKQLNAQISTDAMLLSLICLNFYHKY